MPQADDVQSNVIDLQARLARLRASVISEDAALAAAELQGLRNTLRNLNLIIELTDIAGTPIFDNHAVHGALDEITAELTRFRQILRVLPDKG